MSIPYFRISFLFLFFCCTLPTVVTAQSRRAFEHAGDKAFEEKDYTSAFAHYGSALERAPSNPSLQWKYGESARMFYAFAIAEQAYKSIIADKSALKKYPLAYIRLGELSKMQGDYASAINYYNNYTNLSAVENDPWKAKALTEVQNCSWALEAIKTPNDVKIVHLDKKINSPYSDFAAFGKGDTLYFSSYRVEKKDKNLKKRMSRLMMSVAGRNAREPMFGIPVDDSVHVAHAAFSPEGNFMVFNYCKNINPSEIRCELWLMNKDVKGKWTKPVRLPEPVNQRGFTSTQPSISLDPKNGQQRLWFASDRPGGKGGLDIWSLPLDTIWFCPCNKPLDARKPQKLPKFETPKPVEGINTSENEITPFYHALTENLYFSSEGWQGLGGYDIFKAKESKTGFNSPTNAGPGINSSYNDLYFSLRNNGKTGYLSSNRPGSFYLDERNKACCNDIYALTIPDPPLPTPTPGLEPPITVKTVPPVQTTPQLPPPQLPPQLIDFVGLPLYFDNDEPDKRTRKITTTLTYETTVMSYLDRQVEYRLKRSEGLSPENAEKAENDIDEFFENEVRDGFEKLSQLCELLAVRLETGQSIEIFIKGFTSPRAKSDYNINLGKRRISSVRNYISEWSDGVLKPYLLNGRLRITETSFGETTARLGLSDDLNDERNSIYHPDVARERRVEIVEIK